MATGGQKVFSISDFKHGLDVRKSALTAPGGSLRILENAVLTPGGEIEKRFAFVQVAQLPTGTLGIFGQGNDLHVFFQNTIPPIDPGTIPTGLVQHVLTWANPLVWISDVEVYDDLFYVTALEDTGAAVTFWNGDVVLNIDGNPVQATYARTYKGKVYRVQGRFLNFSGVGNPAQENPADTTNPGAGFIDCARNDADADPLLSMEIFYDKMALMSRLATQLWTLDPDPDKDTLQQVLRIGVVAARSVVQFGTGDILFLADSGVRSLKTMTATLAASVSDVGSAIDPLLIDVIRKDPDYAALAHGVVQPVQGRYWLIVHDTIYVLSYFPAGDITAWSVFKPGFTTMEPAVVGNRLYLRSDANTLYLYGGVSYTEYDASRVTVRTPHHAIDSPTASKRVQSVDIMCQGQWQVSLGMQPSNTELFELCATVQDNTYGLGTIPFAGRGSHVAAHLTHQAAGAATLNSLHFNIQEGVTK